MKPRAPSSDLQLLKKGAIDNSFWQVTVYASFQRAGIYKKKTSPAKRAELKLSLKQEILRVRPDYEREYKSANKKTDLERKHFNNIRLITNSIGRRYKSDLKGEMSLGLVQKALNLYLKLEWCRGDLPEPPHCPVDALILGLLKKDAGNLRGWTSWRSISEYKKAIAQLKAGNFKDESYLTEALEPPDRSLAAWEMWAYQKIMGY